MTHMMNEISNLKHMYQTEIQELKRKLTDSEKRFVHLWEQVKDNNTHTDHRLNDL